MGQSPTYIGRRVQWLGGPQRGFVTDSYRRALAAGDRRLPTAEEQPLLRTNDNGTVTELVSATASGHAYAVVFDSGYEVEVLLPSRTLVRFLDDEPEPGGTEQPATNRAHSPRYATHNRSGGSSTPARLLRAVFRRSQPNR